jgi:hypothetical protein
LFVYPRFLFRNRKPKIAVPETSTSPQTQFATADGDNNVIYVRIDEETTIMMFLTIIQVSYQNVFDQLFADADDGLLQVGNVSPPTRPLASHISTSDKRPVFGDVTNRQPNFANGLA